MSRLFSDLHLEFGTDIISKCITICSADRMKYTILAGDITNFKKRNEILPKLSIALKPYTDHIIYVLGNHEYYECGKLTSSEVRDSYKTLCESLGIHLLENNYLETDDCVFYGTTMWTDQNESAFQRMNDRFSSFKTNKEIVDTHKESLFLLSEFIKDYRSPKPLVVITHHMPSFTLIDKKYECYKEIHSGFASSLDFLITDPIKYWVYGHTHMYSNRLINGVQMICNPLGYKCEGNILHDVKF
jgi:predicted MPP superfamily phosphohydrolase